MYSLLPRPPSMKTHARGWEPGDEARWCTWYWVYSFVDKGKGQERWVGFGRTLISRGIKMRISRPVVTLVRTWTREVSSSSSEDLQVHDKLNGTEQRKRLFQPHSHPAMDKMIRVNQAGERAAVMIYAGQTAVLGKTQFGNLIEVSQSTCIAGLKTWTLCKFHFLKIASSPGHSQLFHFAWEERATLKAGSGLGMRLPWRHTHASDRGSTLASPLCIPCVKVLEVLQFYTRMQRINAGSGNGLVWITLSPVQTFLLQDQCRIIHDRKLSLHLQSTSSL